MNMRVVLPLLGIAYLAVLGSVAFAQGGMMGPGFPNFPGHAGYEIDHNLVLPQIAVGANYSTSLVLLNLGNQQYMSWVSEPNLRTTGRIHLFQPDGSRMLVSANGGSPGSEIPFDLQAGETVQFDLDFAGPDTSCWALIDVDEGGNSMGWGMMDDQEMHRGSRIMATAFYAHRDGARTVSRVGVMPSLYEMGRFFNAITPVQSRKGLFTGVAIVNTGPVTVTLDLLLKDQTGRNWATRQLNLQAGNQMARYIHELFPAIPDGFGGFLEVRSADEGVVTMGILESNGILTAVPTMHYGRFDRARP
ncbi:MAG: hypothetical protein ABIG68_04570 [Acidobacteriota bacterium]